MFQVENREVNVSEALHERLKRLREQKNLTAKEIAKLIGVPASTYHDWEQERGLKLPPFQKLSRVFTVSVTELISGRKPELVFALDQLDELEKSIRNQRKYRLAPIRRKTVF